MLNRRSMREISQMRQAGQLVRSAHAAVAKAIKPGITTRELDATVEQLFDEAGAIPLFKGYPGPVPFPTVTCTSVNEAVVHGIPNDRPLQVGDIVSVDTGCKIDGWCGDAAVTHSIGEVSEDVRRLLDVTQASLSLAIELLAKKERWSDVAREMQAMIEGAGLAVVKQFVGHGIGREMHEAPQVPNFVSRTLLEKEDFRLKTGLVLAIEPMVCLGNDKVRCLSDQWTQVTIDGSFSAHFEHTVALPPDGPELLPG